MSAASSLKTLLYGFFNKLLEGHYLQQLASIGVAITIAVTLLDYFDELLETFKDDFDQLKQQDFSSYLIAFIDLAKLDTALVTILSAVGFALVWRFTYDLKPQIKTGGS